MINLKGRKKKDKGSCYVVIFLLDAKEKTQITAFVTFCVEAACLQAKKPVWAVFFAVLSKLELC